MTPMERVGAVLSGGIPDRRPFACTLSLYGARLSGADTLDHYSKPEVFVAGQRAVVDLCAPDILFGPFALALEAEGYGSTLERFPDSPPSLKKPAVRSARDTQVPRLQPGTDPNLRYLVDSVRALVADQGGRRPVAAVITAPSDLPILLLGMENWLEVLLFQPELADFWSALALDHFEALSAAYFSAGASFLVSPVMMTSPAFMNPELAERTIIPLIRTAFSRLKGPIVFHHGGNRLAPYIGMVRDLPNVAGFALDERDSFVEARAVLGPDTLLLGNLSGPHFSRRSAESIAERTRSLLLEMKDERKFVLATSNADIPWETDPEVLVALRRTIEAGA